MILKIKPASIHPEVLASISLNLTCHQRVSPIYLAGLPTLNSLIEKIYQKSSQKPLFYLTADVDSQD